MPLWDTKHAGSAKMVRAIKFREPLIVLTFSRPLALFRNHMVFKRQAPLSSKPAFVQVDCFRVARDPGIIPRSTANRLRRRSPLHVADHTARVEHRR